MGTHHGAGGDQMSDYVTIIVTAFICITIVKALRIIVDFIAEYYEP